MPGAGEAPPEPLSRVRRVRSPSRPAAPEAAAAPPVTGAHTDSRIFGCFEVSAFYPAAAARTPRDNEPDPSRAAAKGAPDTPGVPVPQTRLPVPVLMARRRSRSRRPCRAQPGSAQPGSAQPRPPHSGAAPRSALAPGACTAVPARLGSARHGGTLGSVGSPADYIPLRALLRPGAAPAPPLLRHPRPAETSPRVSAGAAARSHLSSSCG